MIDHEDELTASDLEQLAASLVMDGSLGQRDALRVARALRELARIRRSHQLPS